MSKLTSTSKLEPYLKLGKWGQIYFDARCIKKYKLVLVFLTDTIPRKFLKILGTSTVVFLAHPRQSETHARKIFWKFKRSNQLYSWQMCASWWKNHHLRSIYHGPHPVLRLQLPFNSVWLGELPAPFSKGKSHQIESNECKSCCIPFSAVEAPSPTNEVWMSKLTSLTWG